MANDTAPVTQADFAALQNDLRAWKAEIQESVGGFKTEILDRLVTFKDEVQRDFHFVAEKLSEALTRLDTIDDKLDGERRSLLTDVHTFVGEDHAILKDHARRLERLERKVGIAA